MANNYKVKMKDIQNKYKFKIFCAGYEYDDTEIKQDILELQGDVSDLEIAMPQKALISETGRYIELELNSSTYVLTAKLYDKNNNLISSSTPIDLPLESMIVNATYDSTTKSLIITLQNGNTTTIPLGDLISGLATEEDLEEVDGKVDANIEKISDLENELNQYKTIYNVLPKVNGNGESITLDNTGESILKLDLKGQCKQDGEPTPDTPIPINVVSGDNEVVVCGKNILEPNSFAQKVIDTPYNSSNVSTYDSTTGALTIKMGNGNSVFDNFEENTQYTIILKMASTTNELNLAVDYTDGTHTYIRAGSGGYTGTKVYVSDSGKTIKQISHNAGDSSGSRIIYLKESGIFKGVLTESDFEPYNGDTYELDLGDIKMRGIGTYEDYFVRNSGKNLANIRNIPNKTTGARITIENDTIKLFDNANTGGYVNSQTPLKTICPDLKVGDIAILSFNTTSSVNQRNRIYFADASSYWDKDGELTITQEMLNSNIALYGGYNETAIISQFMIRIKGTTGIYEPYGKDKWCKYNAIGKVVLDGSEDWTLGSSALPGSVQLITNRFDNMFSGSGATALQKILFSHFANKEQVNGSYIGSLISLFPSTTLGIETAIAFKTWLSTNNVVSNYVLANPYLSLVENDTLKSQLDKVEKALSKDGKTNILQVNNDVPFKIYASALEKISNS